MKIKDLTKGLFTVREVADLCCVTVQAVYKWEKKGRIPAEYCRTLEQASFGAIDRYYLRPDVFGTSADDATNQIKAA